MCCIKKSLHIQEQAVLPLVLEMRKSTPPKCDLYRLQNSE